MIVWVDESGFYLLPARVRTYAPRGQTPLLRVPLTRDHVSAIGALTEHGRLFLWMQRWEAVVRSLRHLLQHIPGKILVSWDGSLIHRSRIIKDFLARGGARRLQLERLPAYVPNLNPVEYVWHYLEHVALRNVCCATLDEVQYELRLAVANLRHKRNILLNWPRHYGYQL
jgi:transposase